MSILLTGNGILNDCLVLSVEFVLGESAERRVSKGDRVPKLDKRLVACCCPPCH